VWRAQGLAWLLSPSPSQLLSLFRSFLPPSLLLPPPPALSLPHSL
jgi:hypothetical protein